ncbi:MAG: nucleotidyltransferase domain-containing protein [bacterium]
MDNKDLEFIKTVIRKYLNNSENSVFIFGSRAIGNYKKYSDYDIGIEGKKLDLLKQSYIEEEFENSNFPYTVDIVDFNQVTDRFRNIAKTKIIPIKY